MEGAEKPGYVVVWAQWSNVDGKPEDKQEVPPEPWFQALRDAIKGNDHVVVLDWRGGDANGEGLAFLTGKWTWPIAREFPGPYDKRTWVTNSTKLNTSGWVDVMIQRMEAALDAWQQGARLVMQVFLFGGPLSAFVTNPQRLDTSYSWRADATGCTVQLVQDCFAALPKSLFPGGLDFAHQWQAQNDQVFKGPGSTFAPDMDRRVLWGSYATNDKERSLDAVWHLYHEDEAKYKRLQATKKAVDPSNTLTPNEFAIRAV